MDRRKLLAGGVAAGALGVTGLAAQPTNAPIPSDLKISVTWNNATYTYPVGPKIPSYYVGFRQDGRIVFHLGALGDLTKANVQPAPYVLGPHQVKIENGATAIFEADVPSHWWNAEWTYRPAPIAVKRTPLYLWALKNVIDRTSGKSGFPPGFGTPYRLTTDPAGWAAAFKVLMTNPEVKMPRSQYDALIADPF